MSAADPGKWSCQGLVGHWQAGPHPQLQPCPQPRAQPAEPRSPSQRGGTSKPLTPRECRKTRSSCWSASWAPWCPRERSRRRPGSRHRWAARPPVL